MARKAFLLPMLAMVPLLLGACTGSEAGTLGKVKKDKRTYVGAVPFEPPLLYQDRQKMVGPEAGLVDKISEKLAERVGHSGAVEPFWITRTYKTLASALTNNEIDLIVSVYGITDERKQEIAFSDPYYISELVLVINPVHNADLTPDTLDKHSIAVRADTAAQAKIQAKYANATIIAEETLDDAILALKRGEVDAVIDDKHMAAYSLATTPGVARLEIVPGVIDTVECAVALRKDEEEVLKLINEVIDEVKQQELYAEWMKQHLPENQLASVLQRHEERLERAKRASQPRQVTIRLSRDRGSTFDIYRFANLNFVLTNQSSGQSYSGSRIDFRGSTGFSSVRVPPGSYRVQVPRFNFTAGTVSISEADASNIGLNITFRSNGTFVMRRT